jgi:class 3 adenylate cyclase
MGDSLCPTVDETNAPEQHFRLAAQPQRWEGSRRAEQTLGSFGLLCGRLTPVDKPVTESVRVGDDVVSYQAVGEGPVICIWCGSAFSHDLDLIWDHPSTNRFLGAIAAVSKLVLPQFSGTGASTRRVEADRLYETAADDFTAVIDAVDAERVVMLAGGDSGSFGLYFTGTRPERVHGLATMNAYARLSRAPDYPWGIPEYVLERAESNAASNWGRGDNLYLMGPSVVDDPEFKSWYAKSERANLLPEMQRERYRAVRSADLRPLLPNITARTVVIQRSDALYVRSGHGRYLADHIAGAKYVEVPGRDHLPYVGDVEPFLAEITELLTGVRGSSPFRAFATVLFSDIAASTLELTAVGDESWRARLDEHDSIAERVVLRNAGRIVKNTGDGCLAVFDSPTRAVACALALRDDLASAGLAVRMGLHAAEIEHRGDDVSGIGVHIAARISALAQPGEILASRTVRDLTLGSKLTFVDYGTHDLKYVSEPWQLYALT